MTISQLFQKHFSGPNFSVKASTAEDYDTEFLELILAVLINYGLSGPRLDFFFFVPLNFKMRISARSLIQNG